MARSSISRLKKRIKSLEKNQQLLVDVSTQMVDCFKTHTTLVDKLISAHEAGIVAAVPQTDLEIPGYV